MTTILGFAGFETGDVTEFISKYPSVATAPCIKTTHPRSGVYECRLSSVTAATMWGAVACTAGAVRAMRCGMYIVTMPTNTSEEVAGVDGSVAQQCAVRLDTTGHFLVYKGDTTTLQATSTLTIATGQWYKFEMKFTNTATTSKTLVIRVDGTEYINTTWTETAANVVDFYVGVGNNKNTSTYDYYFDDIATGDDWIPTMLIPNAIAASTNLTGTVAAVSEPVDAPAATWLTATSSIAVTDLRVSFATPVPNLL
jgi:hypothetical protein